MSARTRRTAASFAVVFVAYWFYRLAINPFIDPPVEWRSPTLAADRATTSNQPDDRLADFQKMFPPDAWERQDPIVLEADSAKLLMKDYENLPDGRVRLSKCTMVFVPEGEPSPNRSRRIIVLQSPEGAMLQFDTPIDLARGKVGRLIGGQLMGQVTIYGTPSRPDAQDELQIVTRDVRLEEQQIWTEHPVEFRYGPNHGRGRELRIDLLPGVQTAKRRGPNVGGVERLQLMHDVQMHIKPSAAGLLPGDGDRGLARVEPGAHGVSGLALAEPVAHNSILDPRSPIPATRRADAAPLALSILDPQSSPRNEPPIDIRCQGPFKFDLVNQVASFEDRVDVNRSSPEGVSDQLRCEMLKIHFAPREPATTQTAATDITQPPALPGAMPTALSGHAGEPPASRPGAMEPRRLEALGNPVTVTAPSSGAIARGNRLLYDIRLRRITIEADRDQPEVTLVQLGSEFHGRSIMFERPVVGGLPNARVDGAGWFRMVPPDDARNTVEARWTKELTLQPADGSHRLSLLGEATTNFTQFGDLRADEIHLWLRQSATAVAGIEDRGAGIEDRGWRTEETQGAMPTALSGHANMHASRPTIDGLPSISMPMQSRGHGTPQHSMSYRPVVDEGANARSPRMRTVPERMMALRRVRFSSPQLSGSTEHLEVWFDANGTPLLNNAIGGGNGTISNDAGRNPTGASRTGGPIQPLDSNDRGGAALSSRPANFSSANDTMSRGAGRGNPLANLLPTAGSGRRNAGPMPRQRFELEGKLIRVQLVTRGVQTQLEDVTVEGGVRFIETQFPNVTATQFANNTATQFADVSVKPALVSPERTTAERPMSMTGDRLQVLRASSPDTSVTLSGKPAQVSARGMEMIGDRIRLERSENLLWIEGAGRMNLPANANAQRNSTAQRAASTANPASNGLLPMAGAQSAPLTIDFQGGMNFDGQIAKYFDGVVVNSESRTIRAERPAVPKTELRVMKTEQLEVRLKQRVDFAAASDSQRADPQRTEVDRLDCIGGVDMENRTSDERGVIALEQINTRDLSIQQTSGAIRAQGPGWVRSVRLGSAAGAMAMPGASTSRASATRTTTPAAAPGKEQINYLHVDFQRELTGNLHHRELVLHEDVRCVYGPIEKWSDRLDADRPERNGPGSVTVGCDQLVVTQMPATSSTTGNSTTGNPANAYSNELQAIGNTLVEGQQFLARAHRLSYVEGKEQLVLEGDGRSDAELYYQQAAGGARTEARAGKITYWPSTGRYDVDKARFINLGQLGPATSAERGVGSAK